MKDPRPAPDGWLLDTLRALRATLERVDVEEATCLAALHANHRDSARNLLQVMAFHRHAHPDLPKALRLRGLCPLTDGDTHLLSSLEAVITALEALEGLGPMAATPAPLGDPDVLQRQGERLFGAVAAPGGAGLMVTLPAEAAERPALIADLLQAGMTIARIDCAHGDPEVWGRMVEGITQTRAAAGRPCAIAMDLAGPKLRTGQLAPQPAVIRARPPRDRMGRATQPVRILAVPPGATPAPQDPDVVLLPARLSKAKRLRPGDRLRGHDASGRRRTLTVLRRLPDGLLLRAGRTCRFVAGLVFRQRHGKARLLVGPLAPVSGERLLRPGDALRLTPEPDRGAGTLPCTLPEVFFDLRLGERVLFDAGRIGGVIRGVAPQEVVLEVTAARARGSRLGSDRGINLPDSDRRTPALSAKDIDDLAFVARHADLIGCSGVHRDSDLQTLRQCLEDRGRTDLALLLTINTRQAFLNLPRLLLAAMGHAAPVGVMIARGDLAIECGWEALAPIQEEILRICTAAHVPCLWSTETVLEGIVARSTGDPSKTKLTGLAFRSNGEADDPLP
ncbi:pyruvate kinase [Cyanobium gracile]|uniref:pyruvate kinase n=1 Tax=Cyanobium gracile UHCC 0281 TaxID=3110309 RepID=A0ABU5SSG7_9CYAN|nr:pyruvate kinase [Cyanobium gracile]MEA5441445.1 pyruvate kinase [Cyanobium gracile UHCC 0281]